jgi:hypothetical protein
MADLEYTVNLENDSYESLEMRCSLTREGEERYSLDAENGGAVILTGPEFDDVALAVERFRKMKELI